MRKFKCHICGAGLHKETTDLTSAKLKFCKPLCLMKHIVSIETKDKPLCVIDNIGRGFGNSPDYTCHSVRLGQTFRSSYEMIFAKYMVRRKFKIWYESHIVEIGPDKIYIPDFLFSQGVFIEIKGKWAMGAKKKYEAAQERLGADRMILVPDYIIKAMDVEVRKWDKKWKT